MTDDETPGGRLEVPAATWLALTDAQREAISVIPTAVTLGQPAEVDGMLAWDDGRLTGDDIAAVVSVMTSIPVVKLEEEESEKLLRMESDLTLRVVGQDSGTVSPAARRTFTAHLRAFRAMMLLLVRDAGLPGRASVPLQRECAAVAGADTSMITMFVCTGWFTVSSGWSSFAAS